MESRAHYALQPACGIQIREKTLKFSSTVLSTLSPCHKIGLQYKAD